MSGCGDDIIKTNNKALQVSRSGGASRKKMKTNKSYSKRIKVTKNGKLIARKAGQNHFNAKEGGRSQISKGRTQSIVMTQRDKRRYFGTSSI